MLKITLKKSPIGYEKSQRATVQALGLGKISSSTLKPDNPQVRGMIKKVVHLVAVDQVDQAPGGNKSETE